MHSLLHPTLAQQLVDERIAAAGGRAAASRATRSPAAHRLQRARVLASLIALPDARERTIRRRAESGPADGR